MNLADFERLLDEVVRESGARGRTKREIRQELESHVWEAVRELVADGTDRTMIPKLIHERFGSPKEIGKLFSLMHGFRRNVLRIALPIVAVAFALVILVPGDAGDAVARYRTSIREDYLDVGWYNRAVEVEARTAGATCQFDDRDGIGITYIPSGHILTMCDTRWLVLKLLPPIQIAGTRIEQRDVLHVMKMEGGLRDVDAVYGEAYDVASAQWVLEDFLHTLAVGAGNAPTDDMRNGVFDEPEAMGEEVDRQWAFSAAATWWGGDLAVLTEWHPDVDPNDEAALWKAACERQLYCYEAKMVTVKSVSEQDGNTTIQLEVELAADNELVASTTFTFEVTRFEDGYPNDATDDRTRVTSGFAYLD